MHSHRILDLGDDHERGVGYRIRRFVALVVVSFLVLWCAAVGLAVLAYVASIVLGIAGWARGAVVVIAFAAGAHQAGKIIVNVWRQ